MIFQSLIEGLLAGVWMGLVLGPAALWGAHMRLTRGWRYAIFLAVGGSLGDLAIALFVLPTSAFLTSRLDAILKALQNGIVQGAFLALVGTLLLLAPQEYGGGRKESKVHEATTFVSLFVVGFGGPFPHIENWFSLTALFLYLGSAKLPLVPLLIAYFIGALSSWCFSLEVTARVGAAVGQAIVSKVMKVIGVACIGLGGIRILWALI